MTDKLPVNLNALLRQRTVESERIEYKAGWNPDPIIRTLCAFANDFENLGGAKLPKTTKSLIALSRQMNIAGGTKEALWPKNVGLLFFNETPERFFPGTQIDVLWFPHGAGGSRFDEKVFKGPLGRMTREALDYIQRNYLRQTVIKHPQRAEATRIWNFPYAAIEEAVVNAVYHRSYEEREPIEVRISPDELAILSFPGPDRSISMADLQAGKAISRRYRNRRIGEFLKELDLTEGRSTGIPKIIKEMEANGSPGPLFETDEERISFVIRLPVHVQAQRPDMDENMDSTTDVAPSTMDVTTDVAPSTTDVTPSTTDVTTDVASSTTDVSPSTMDVTTDVSPSTTDVTTDVAPSTMDVTTDVAAILNVIQGEMTRKTLQAILGLKNAEHFRKAYLAPALANDYIEMTLPDKPRSTHQGYRLTAKGQQWRKETSKPK